MFLTDTLCINFIRFQTAGMFSRKTRLPAFGAFGRMRLAVGSISSLRHDMYVVPRVEIMETRKTEMASFQLVMKRIGMAIYIIS